MELRVGDRVRLRVPAANAAPGTEGHVFGLYRRHGRDEVVVALNGRMVTVEVREVEPVARPGAHGDDPQRIES